MIDKRIDYVIKTYGSIVEANIINAVPILIEERNINRIRARLLPLAKLTHGYVRLSMRVADQLFSEVDETRSVNPEILCLKKIIVSMNHVHDKYINDTQYILEILSEHENLISDRKTYLTDFWTDRYYYYLSDLGIEDEFQIPPFINKRYDIYEVSNFYTGLLNRYNTMIEEYKKK